MKNCFQLFQKLKVQKKHFLRREAHLPLTACTSSQISLDQNPSDLQGQWINRAATLWVSGSCTFTVLSPLSPLAPQHSGDHSYQPHLHSCCTSVFSPPLKGCQADEELRRIQ